MLSAFNDASLFGERTGDAPLTVLCLHGWGRTHQDFTNVVSPPDDHALDAISLDLPGFGATPAPPRAFGSHDYAAFIAPILEEATGPVIVVGHSHGGRVALCLAADHPEKVAGLVLIGAPVLTRQASRPPSLRYRILRAANRWHLVSDERMEAIRRRSGSADYAAATGVMRETLVTVVNESFEAELANLTCPVALVWGSLDTDVPLEVAERAEALIGSSQASGSSQVSLTVLEGVGHLVPTSAPRAVRAVIDQLVS